VAMSADEAACFVVVGVDGEPWNTTEVWCRGHMI